MNLEDIQEQINNLEGSDKSKKAILKIINIKIENDMDKVVTRIEASIGSLNNRLETSIGSLKTSILSNRSEMTFIKWLLGGIGAIGLAILAKMFS